MRAVIKKTGEIVDVYHETQHGSTEMIYKESVLVNSRMWAEDELEVIPNYEEIKHWQDVRERAAIAALQGLLANPKMLEGYSHVFENITETAMHCTNLFIKKLKKEYEE